MDTSSRVTQSASAALASLRITSSSSTFLSSSSSTPKIAASVIPPSLASPALNATPSLPLNQSADGAGNNTPRPMTTSSSTPRSRGLQRRQSERPGPELGAAPAQMEAWKRALREDFHESRKGHNSNCGSRASVSASAAMSLAAMRMSRTAQIETSKPHATRPHQPELAQPPPETLQTSVEAAVVEDTVNTTNAVYGHCKPRETFSRVGLRPSTEYIRVMERLDTARANAREARRRKTSVVSEPHTPDRSGTSCSGRSKTQYHRITGTAGSNATSICLFGVAIDEDEEFEDDISAEHRDVGQAAPMVFSLERPEESTLEVLQLEVDRQSEAGGENGDFDETELHLYKIQPRENPHLYPIE